LRWINPPSPSCSANLTPQALGMIAKGEHRRQRPLRPLPYGGSRGWVGQLGQAPARRALALPVPPFAPCLQLTGATSPGYEVPLLAHPRQQAGNAANNDFPPNSAGPMHDAQGPFRDRERPSSIRTNDARDPALGPRYSVDSCSTERSRLRVAKAETPPARPGRRCWHRGKRRGSRHHSGFRSRGSCQSCIGIIWDSHALLHLAHVCPRMRSSSDTCKATKIASRNCGGRGAP
jgi:hypothetical protein